MFEVVEANSRQTASAAIFIIIIELEPISV